MSGKSRFINFAAVLLFSFLLSGGITTPQQKIEEDRGGLVFSGSYTKHSQSKLFSHRLEERTKFELRGENRIELPNNYQITIEFSYWRDYGIGDLLNIYSEDHKIKIVSNARSDRNETDIVLRVNEEPTEVRFPLHRSKMTRKFRHKLIFAIDEAKGEMAVTFNGVTKQVITAPLPASRLKDLRIVETECPSIIVWDMKIDYDGETRHHWPFYEYSGSVAHDVVGGKHAQIQYPEWAINEHHYWTLTDSFAFDEKDFVASAPMNYQPGYVLLLKDRLYRYGFESNRFDTVLFERKEWLPGGFPVIDRTDSFLVYNSGYPSEPGVVNIHTGKWESLPVGHKPEGFLYRATPIYEAATGENYLVGGYGWFKYFKKVHKFNKTTRQWDTLQLKRNDMIPLYHVAVLPTTTPGVYYIFGGTGGRSGRQEDGEKNFRNLYRLDLQKLTLELLWEDKEPAVDAFSHFAPWAGKDRKQFYARGVEKEKEVIVRFSIDGSQPEKYDIATRGADDKPAHELACYPETGRIYGVRSWHSPKDQKYIFKVFAINSPFMNSRDYNAYKEDIDGQIAALERTGPATWLLVAAVILPVGFISYYIRKRRSRKGTGSEPLYIRRKDESAESPVDAASGGGFVTVFGGLQVVDSEGKDHLDELSAKPKELLGYLIWYSFTGKNRGKGVTLDRLTEVFWEDIPEENIKNNRNVSLSKIRGALAGFGKLQIKNEDLRIRVEIDPTVNNEVAEFIRLIKKLESGTDCTKEDLNNFIAITRRGKPFEGCEAEWADTLSSELAGRIIDVLLKCGESLFNGGDYDLAIQVANVIPLYEKLSEEALRLKLKSLTAKGLHTFAKDVYESFVRDYRAFFEEDYTVPLDDLLS